MVMLRYFYTIIYGDHGKYIICNIHNKTVCYELFTTVYCTIINTILTV